MCSNGWLQGIRSSPIGAVAARLLLPEQSPHLADQVKLRQEPR